MTRFARAQGSKASNKRLPEDATSWSEMQQTLRNNNDEGNKELSSSKGKSKVVQVPPASKWSSLSAENIKKPIQKTSKKNTSNNNNVKEYKRRKPHTELNKVFINGLEIELAYFDGFPIKKSDATRLKQLKKDMISKGIPRNEINIALKLERRKAEKALAREKKKVCFNCRYGGHTLSQCPELNDAPNIQQFETGICFKCGSTEHTHFECKVNQGEQFKFAQCFICKEQGHIARQCPDNNRGIYPNGGACGTCGDVTHLKKDCSLYQARQTESKAVAHKINYNNIEALESEPLLARPPKSKTVQKVVKF